MAPMRVKWAEGTPERAWVELWIRVVWALKIRQLVEWVARRLAT